MISSSILHAVKKNWDVYVYSRNNETLARVSECEWNLLLDDDDEFQERIILKMEIRP